MKRTNLVLDDVLLEEARRAFGTKTYSETVNRALAEVIRLERIRSLPQLSRQVKWEGDLDEMRRDRSTPDNEPGR